MTHSLAISRDLEAAGIEKKHAEAIAGAVVTHSDESFATKADIAELKGEIKALSSEMRGQMNLLMGLVCGLYIGLALLVVDNLSG